MMNRRTFSTTLATGIIGSAVLPGKTVIPVSTRNSIRLGGPLFGGFEDPEQWIDQLRVLGYRAAYCPVGPEADDPLVFAYEAVAKKNDVVIAEVGAWSNPLSPDPGIATEAVEKCISHLELADRINARCCVNISGSLNQEHWAGPHKDNLTRETFDRVVEITRKVIDAVKPRRTSFALEAMPWSFPDCTETYLELLKAIDRSAFGVHIDPVNMIRSPREYYNNGALIREMFRKLGPHIKSCHAKDIILREDNYIPQLDELQPGLGNLDYVVYLQELARLEEVPLMMEHLKTAEEYKQAAAHIRSVGEKIGINL